MEKNIAAEMHLATIKTQAAIIASLTARLSVIATMAENGEHGIAALAREAAGVPAETPKPVAWSVGSHLFHSYDEALRNVRNPDLKPEPLYAAQPAPAPATDARRSPTLTEMQAIIRKGSLVSNTDAWTIAENVLSMLSANSLPRAPTA